MTKLSPDFTFKIKDDADPMVAYCLGFFIDGFMHLSMAENGVELLRFIAQRFPEIEIIKE